MEIKQIKELMEKMAQTGMTRVVIKKEGVEIELERKTHRFKSEESSVDYSEEMLSKNRDAFQKANMVLSRGGEIPTKGKEEALSGVFVTSPMVGTFYVAPSVDAQNFVKIGDRIEKDTIIGIVEAMKVMNEIKAGVAGIVTETLVENGHPVEFGTKLFRIT